jgi:hypothetical protein
MMIVKAYATSICIEEGGRTVLRLTPSDAIRISNSLKDALEDHKFYNRDGVDVRGIPSVKVGLDKLAKKNPTKFGLPGRKEKVCLTD